MKNIKTGFLHRAGAAVTAVLMIGLAGCGEKAAENSSKQADETTVRIDVTEEQSSPIVAEEISASQQEQEDETENTERSADTVSILSVIDKDSIKAGDHFTFGNYPQDTEEPEPIEWRVLDVNDGTALVISEKLLDCVQFNNVTTPIEWEVCTLRKWMNNDFYNAAFSEDEKKAILTTGHNTYTNPRCFVANFEVKYTEDKVYCLSYTSADGYFPTAEEAKAVPTAYAISHGAYVSKEDTVDGEGTGRWWHRTPGDFDHFCSATITKPDGEMYWNGRVMNSKDTCVRPAMYVAVE